MKKADKPILIEAFDKFVEQNSYFLESSSMKMQLYFAPIKRDSHKIFDHRKQQFLFEDKMNQLQYLDRVYNFISYMFEQESYKNVGYRFLVEKSPVTESRDYSTIMSAYLKILSPYPDLLYDYVTRPSFLKANFTNLSSLFDNYIKEQNQREAIIDFYIGLGLSHDFKKEHSLYNYVQTYITNKEKYKNTFTNIIKEEKKESVSFIQNKKSGEYYNVTFSINDCIRFAPNRVYSDVQSAINVFKDLEDYYMNMGVNEIKIGKENSNFLTNGDIDGKAVEVTFYGEKLNKVFLDRLIEKVMSEYLLNPSLKSGSINNKLNINNSDTKDYLSWLNNTVKETSAQLLMESINEKVTNISNTNKKYKSKL